MSIDAMKQALEALEPYARQVVEKGDDYEIAKCDPKVDTAITALRLAIEQAERVKRAEEAFAAASEEMKGEQAERQEPVAWVCEGSSSDEKHAIDYQQEDVDAIPIGTILYTAPPQLQPLTEAELNHLWETIYDHGHGKYMGEQSRAQRERAFEILKRIGGTQ